jgi:hypothetical protein
MTPNRPKKAQNHRKSLFVSSNRSQKIVKVSFRCNSAFEATKVVKWINNNYFPKHFRTQSFKKGYLHPFTEKLVIPTLCQMWSEPPPLTPLFRPLDMGDRVAGIGSLGGVSPFAAKG